MSEDSSTFRQSLSVLRHGLFARFMAAEFVSMIGAWMQTQAQQMLVEEQARTSLDQALVSFALMIVIPLFGPWGGTLADRLDRRRIICVVILAQALLAVLVGILVQTGTWKLWHLGVIAVLLGISHAFEGPAYSALLPKLVPREKMAAAIGIDRSIFHGGRIVGPALAGVVIGYFGIASAFYINALTFIGPLIILIFLLPGLGPDKADEPERQTGFMAGWSYARNDGPTLRLLCIMAANSLFCSPFVIILLTFYARRTLQFEPEVVGILMALTGVGALIASFGLLAIPPRHRNRFLRGGAIVTVASMLGLAAAQNFAAAAVSFALLTGGLNLLFGIGNQVIQERAPDAIRGRVSAVVAMSFVAVIPFSGILAALLESQVGMRAALVWCALGYGIVVTFLFARRWPGSAQA
jgi:MFS family permease